MVNLRAWLAEGISTFGLVFFGPLSVILAVVVLPISACPRKALETETLEMPSLSAISCMVTGFGILI